MIPRAGPRVSSVPGYAASMSPGSVFDAVLFDRDGTLVDDVAYNGDPDLVVPVPGASGALARLRVAGIAVGVVTNQSGLARGRFTAQQLFAVNARVSALLGPFATLQVCAHGVADGCRCRKPRPGLILSAAASLGLISRRCVVVGDRGSDLGAAAAAGAAAILVPGPATTAAEIAAAPVVAGTLDAAIDLILSGQLPLTRCNWEGR